MSIKTVLVICAQALLIQNISAQCLGYDGFGYDGFGYDAPFITGPCGLGPASLTASHGPGLAVTSSSPRIPSGVSVLSENAYEGALAMGGAVPFLGTVAMEGALPTAGAGAIAYGCGKGTVGITTEDIAAYIIDEPFEYGLPGSFGYGAGFGAEPIGIAYGRGRLLGTGADYCCGRL